MGAEETLNPKPQTLNCRSEQEALERKLEDYSRQVVYKITGPGQVAFNDEIHAVADDGASPLHWAADCGHSRVVKVNPKP